MKTVPTMEKVVTRIAKKHGFTPLHPHQERRMRLELEGSLPLTLIACQDYITLSQLFEEEGDVLGGQEVMYYTGKAGWMPVHACRFPRLYEAFAKPDWKRGTIRPVTGQEEKQAEEALLSEEWARELEAQGWLERGARSK